MLGEENFALNFYSEQDKDIEFCIKIENLMKHINQDDIEKRKSRKTQKKISKSLAWLKIKPEVIILDKYLLHQTLFKKFSSFYYDLEIEYQSQKDKIPTKYKISKITDGLKIHLQNNWNRIVFDKLIKHLRFESMVSNLNEYYNLRMHWLAKSEKQK